MPSPSKVAPPPPPPAPSQQVRGQRVHFPLRRTQDSCADGCNYLAQSIADGINRGLELGRL